LFPILKTNAQFTRQGMCLLEAQRSQSLIDCTGCRTIAFCVYYDRDGARDLERFGIERWETDGGTPRT
jgi:hypothetical protein